ncbi:Ig-like domain-containing protein [Tropicibacter alexandrii]|uniref:Ig-like domain-containing protein n=1 Tax=Tropicibacter alexandrii TaxID=2267683 RepID=UPI000EF4C735|nr:Ig-like domain-containing protein [Tropicibacter alexandrii]
MSRSKKNQAKGTKGDDLLTGTSGRDDIKGRDGNDTVMGLDGSDKLYGQNGNDLIDGGSGDDKIDGGSGSDTLEGGAGDDVIKGGKGNDLITDAGGDDKVDAGTGDDTIQLADGDNDVKAKDGDDLVETGAGDDSIDAGDGDDMVTSGAGDDVVKAGAGADTVLAGAGRDILIGDGSGGGSGSGHGSHDAGSGFDDYLDGGAGDDWIVGGAGADTVLGGAGDDVLFGDEGGNGRNWYRAGSTEDFMNGSGSGHGRGSGSGHGSGSGGGFDDYLDGGSGNDFVFAGGGNDTVVHGGTENIGATDSYDGGDGIDTLDLYLTQDQYEAAASEIAAFQAFVAANTDPVTGEANDASFTFASLGLTVQAFEQVAFHTANDDAVSVSEDASATVFASILDNDFGTSDVVDVRLVPGSSPALGVLSFNDPATGQFSYDPDGAFEHLAVGETAEVSFEYEIEFANGRTDTATVTITITGENDAPTISVTGAQMIDEAVDASSQALSDSGTVSFDDIDASDVIDITYASNGDMTWSGGVLDSGIAAALEAGFATGATDADAPGSTPWTFAATVDLDFLSAGDTLSWSYTVTADDGNGGTASEVVSFTITGTNDAPTLAAGVLAAEEDGAAVVLDLSALGDDLDSDDDGASLTYTVTGAPGEGAASISGTDLSFDPGGDFQDLAVGETRQVTIEVTATDAHGATAVNDVTVTITGTNDAPTLEAGVLAAEEDGAAVVLDLSALGDDADSDDDGSSLTYTVTGAPGEGSASITGTDLSFDPGSDFQDLAVGETRQVTIEVTATDAHGATAVNEVVVTVTGTNDAPVAQPLTGAVMEDDAPVQVAGAIEADTYAPNAGRFYVFDFDTGQAITVARDGGTNNTYQQIADQYLSNGNGIVVQLNPNNLGWGAAGMLFDDGTQSPIPATDWIVTDTSGGTVSYPAAAPEVLAFGDDNTAVDAIALALNGITLSDGRTVDLNVSVAGIDYEVFTTDDLLIDAVRFNADISNPSASQVTVAAAYTDVDASDTHTFSIDTTGTMGAVSDNGDGTFTYDSNGAFEHLAEGETTTDTFTYTVDDGNGGTDTQTVTITITGTNDAPALGAGVLAADEDGAAVVLDLSALGDDVDSDDDGASLTYTVTGAPGEGSASITGTDLSFDPAADFQDLAVGETRQVTIEVTATDAHGATAVNDVTVTVTGTNDAPTLSAGVLAVEEDGAAVLLDLSALGDDVDSDDDGASLTYTVTGAPGEGAASITGTDLSFDPGSDFQDLAVGETRQVTIEVTATDAHGATAVNDVTVTVTGTNDAPVAQAVAETVGEDGPAVTVAANYTDVDTSDTHTVSIDTTGTVGLVTDNGDGTFSYDPNGAFEALGCDETATDTFTYTVDDGNGGSATQVVTITITGTNDAPVVSGAVTTALTEDDAVATLDLLANASDVEGDALAVIDATAVSSDGRVVTTTVDAATGEMSFDPAQFNDLAAGEAATVTVDYGVVETDRGYADSAGAEVLDNAGTFFIADDDSGELIRVKRSPSVVTHEQALAVAGVTNGSVVLVDGNSTGLGLSVRVIDDGVVTNPGVDVVDLGDYAGPVTVDSAEVPSRYITVNGDMDAETITVTIPRADADCGDTVQTFTFTDVSQGNGISYTTPQIGGLALAVTGLPVAATAAITITGVNDAPTLGAGVLAAEEDGAAVVLDLSALGDDVDSDDNGSSLTYTVTGQPGEGSATITGTDLSFDPGGDFQDLAVGETRQVTIEVTATDAHGATAVNDVTVTVTGTNDAPTLSAGVLAAEEDGAAVVLDLSALGDDVDSDDDGASLTYTVTGAPGEGSATITGTDLSFDPGSDFQDLAVGETRQVTIEVTATDAHGATAVNDVTVTVTGTNDAPEVTAIDAGAVTESDPAVTIDLLAGQTDVDNGAVLEAINITVTDDLGNAVAYTDNGDGTISIDPDQYDALNTGEQRTLTVDYDVSDGIAATSNTATLVVDGEADNFAPTANDDTLGGSGGDTSVDWLTDAPSTIGSIGEPNTAYYGQTFVAEGPSLNEVSFGLNAYNYGDDVEFRVLIVEVDLTEISPGYWDIDPETVLFESGAMSVASGTSETVSVDTAGLTLTEGQTYAVIIDAFSEFDGVYGTGNVDYYFNGTGDPDGQFFYLNVNGGDRATHFDQNWSDRNGQDMALALDFGDPVLTDENTAHTIAAADLLANDTDPDGDVLSISAVSALSALGATVVLNGDGSVSYDPTSSTVLDELAEGETLQDSFTYTVSDGNGGFDTATVTLTVSGVDDPPILTGVTAAQSGFTDEPFSYQLPADLFTDHDEGEAITYDVTLADGSPLPSFMSFDAATRTVSYAANAPQSSDVGLYSLQVTATEPDGQSNSTTFTLSILDGDFIEGTSGNDNLTGTIQGDLIQGLAGNDTITGLPGADVLDGGTGDDYLYGDAGNDVLIGGEGRDRLYGEEGDDNLYGGDGNDYLVQGDGFGVLDGGAGDDYLQASTQYSGIVANEVLLGGEGNDTIRSVGFYSNDDVDAGAGDDLVMLYLNGGWSASNAQSTSVTLGAGADVVEVERYSSISAFNDVNITDFNVSEDSIRFDDFLAQRLIGWDGASNPFGASGYLQLVDDGMGNTILQVDSNGGGDTFVDLITFEGVAASSFTASNFDSPWPPDGSAPVGQTITGTAASETLDGTIGGDTILGLGGTDFLNGNAGNDSLDGGADNDYLYGDAGEDTLIGGDGRDYLYGEEGNDTLYGGDGDDYLIQGQAVGLLDGGAGNDYLRASTDSSVQGGVETLLGGDGNDTIQYVGYYSSDVVDAGSGDDLVILYLNGGWSVSNAQSTSVTLGAGADVVQIDRYSNITSYNLITITDFDVSEDSVRFDDFLAQQLSGWDGASNPFGASGYLQLVDDGMGNAVLQIDRDGGGDSFMSLLVFDGIAASSFTASNFDSPWPPDGSAPVGQTITGTAASETLDGSIGGDTILGLGGTDFLNGNAGNDSLDGGADTDYLYGDAGEDTLIGGDGRDYLYGEEGDDTLYGGLGDDYMTQGQGGGLLDGGAGNDYLQASTDYSPQGNAETLLGGDGNDTIRSAGSYSSDVVDAGAGDDLVSLYLNGGWSVSNALSTSVTLGAGADILEIERYSSVSDYNEVTVTDFAVGEDVVLFGDFLVQQLSGWDGASNPFGAGYLRLSDDGLGNSVLEIDRSGGGDSYQQLMIFEGVAPDDLSAANFLIDLPSGAGYEPDGSGVNGSTQVGTVAAETLTGSIGDDNLQGVAGNDTLLGGNGNDALDGGDGDDLVVGGFGNDDMTGGAGADSFVFALGEGDDVIQDFALGTDVLVLNGGQTIAGFSEVDTDLVVGVDATLVEFGDGATVLLQGVLGVTDANDLI